MFSLSDAIAGAAIALCGVFVSQLSAMIQSRLDRENKKHVLLRTKYEEMGLHFYRLALCFSQSQPSLRAASCPGPSIKQAREHGAEVKSAIKPVLCLG